MKESTDYLTEALFEKQVLEDALEFRFRTTFWEEFSIAERYGLDGIKEHFDLVFDQWKDKVEYLTELVLVLNLKIFFWCQKDDEIGLVYDELWRKADTFALDHLKGKDLHYYLSTLD